MYTYSIGTPQRISWGTPYLNCSCRCGIVKMQTKLSWIWTNLKTKLSHKDQAKAKTEPKLNHDPSDHCNLSDSLLGLQTTILLILLWDHKLQYSDPSFGSQRQFLQFSLGIINYKTLDPPLISWSSLETTNCNTPNPLLGYWSSFGITKLIHKLKLNQNSETDIMLYARDLILLSSDLLETCDEKRILWCEQKLVRSKLVMYGFKLNSIEVDLLLFVQTCSKKRVVQTALTNASVTPENLW